MNKEKRGKGRPSKLTQDHIDLIDEYLLECEDEWKQMKKSESENVRGSSSSWDNIIKVNLPSFVGLLDFYYRKDRKNKEKRLEICEDTLSEWKKRGKNKEETNELYINFSLSCKKIMRKQQIMLLNGGVSNIYNGQITKMLLNVNHGYKEIEKIEHSGVIENKSDLKNLTTEELLQRKKELEKELGKEVEKKNGQKEK